MMSQPITKICVFDHVLHPTLVEEAYELLQVHRIPASTIYLTLEKVDQHERLNKELSRYVAEPVAAVLAAYCMALRQCAANVFAEDLNGFEIWTNTCVESGADVWLHVDNDEIHRKATGEVRCPLFGSVLHLGPMAGMTGGETFLCLNDHPGLGNLVFKTLPWSVVTATLAGSGIAVPFQSGRTILFDGSLAHCVAPFRLDDQKRPRMTLLVNGWTNAIKI